MPTGITNRFRILLAEKETREQRRISLKEVQRQTGIAWGTLQSWANNKVTRFDTPVVVALCEYFECDLEDLLRLEK